MAQVGDGVRDANRRRNERQSASKRRDRAMKRAEARELELVRGQQAELKQQFYEREARRRAA